MNLKHSEGYHKTVGSKYLVGSRAAPYCNSKYLTHLVVTDAKTQHRLIDQLFLVPNCVRLSRVSENSHEQLTKILRAVPERSSDEMEEIMGEDFVKWGEGNISKFQRKKAKGIMSSDFPTIREKDEMHQTMMEIETLLIASGYRTWRNILLTHGQYPCRCLVQTFWYPKRANLVLVCDDEEIYSMGLPDKTQNVTILLVIAMRAVRWLEANPGTTEQDMAVPTPEQLSRVSLSKKLDLFRTICKVLRIPKAIEKIWARQRLMPWFRAVMTAWVYERPKRHMSRNTEAYQSFQLDVGPGAYKIALLTHRNAVITAVKKVA